MYGVILIMLVVVLLFNLFDIWDNIEIVLSDGAMVFSKVASMVVVLIWLTVVPIFWYANDKCHGVTYQTSVTKVYNSTPDSGKKTLQVMVTFVGYNGMTYRVLAQCPPDYIIDKPNVVPYTVYYYKKFKHPWLVGAETEHISSATVIDVSKVVVSDYQ